MDEGLMNSVKYAYKEILSNLEIANIDLMNAESDKLGAEQTLDKAKDNYHNAEVELEQAKTTLESCKTRVNELTECSDNLRIVIENNNN